jgi:hypothetical protein
MDEVQFLANKLVQDGVIRNLEVIGEASNNTRCSSFLFLTPLVKIIASQQDDERSFLPSRCFL